MSLRVQKSWAQIGAPTQAGSLDVPGLGTIVNLEEQHLETAQQHKGAVQLVLAHLDSDGFDPEWEIVELRPAS